MSYWERMAELAEQKAQMVAANRSKYVKRLHAQYQRRISVMIDELYAQIMDVGAESVTRTQLWRYGKFQAIKRQLLLDANELRNEQCKVTENVIRRAYEQTLRTSLDAIIGKGRWNVPTNRLVEQYLRTPWSGELYSKRIWSNVNKLAADLEKHIGDLLVLGKNPSDLKQQLMRDYGVSYHQADTLIRTEASNAYNTAALEAYDQAGLARVKFLAERDGLLCERCRTYSLENGGVYPIHETPHIPVHPRCRCCYAPVVDLNAEAKEIVRDRQKELASSGRPDILKGIPMNLQFFAAPADLSRQSRKSIEKGIRSLQTRIDLHRDKITNPTKYDSAWDEKSPEHRNGLLKHWKSEIKNYENQIDESRKELKGREQT